MLTVRGRCVSEASAANLPVPGRQISVWDGDVALDFKVVSGVERAGVNLYTRIQGGTYMAAYVSLATGQAELFRREDGVNTIVRVHRRISASLTRRTGTELALRLSGDQIWLLLNDAPLLHAADVLNQAGGIGIAVVREGHVDDRDEVAVVFRDLTLTELQGSPSEERQPPDSEPSEPAPESDPPPLQPSS